jgi:ParB family chromosome partitioning protein
MENPNTSSQLTALRGPQGETNSSQVNPNQDQTGPTFDKPQHPNNSLQFIPLEKLQVHPNNPRTVTPPETIEALASNMKEAGQQTPIKVTNQGNGNYWILGGQRRYLAAKLLGWDGLNAMILDIPPDRALVVAYLDNDWEQMPWLNRYQALEAIIAHDPKLTQKAAGIQINESEFTVSRALKLLPYLNPISRGVILSQAKNPQAYQVSERAVYALTDLNDPQKVEETLNVVIDKKMTESQAKRLVKWVKAGNSPESFSDSGKSVKVKKLEGGGSQALGDGSVDDGVAGFEKVASAGIPENREGSSQENLNQQPGETELSGTDSTLVGRSPQTGVASSLTPAYSAGIPRNDSYLVGSKDPITNDPYSSYWQKLPPNVTVTRTGLSYEIHAVVAPNEVVPAAYGLLANLEHLKGLANETQDLQFRNALPQVMEEGRKARIAERTTIEESGKVPAEGTFESVKVTQEKVEGGTAKVVEKSESTEETQKPTLIETMKTMVKDKMKTAPTDVTDALLKDGKQALNYQIRKGMRGILKDLF